MRLRALGGAAVVGLIAVGVACDLTLDAEPMDGIQVAPAPAPAPDDAPPAPVPSAAPCSAVFPLALPTQGAKSPLATAATPKITQALQITEDVVRTHALDPQDPWAVGHAILSLGPEVQLSNGQPAVDWLFTEYADVEDVRGSVGVGFPGKRGKIRIEPHTDLLLKAFTEAGVDPARMVTVDGQPHTVEELYRRSVCAAWVDGQQLSFGRWNDAPWTLQALSTWASPGAEWTADGGHPMTMDGFASATVATLRRETAFLREARAKGQTFKKERQAIFGYTCGGAHLIQGAAWSVGRGFGTPEDRRAIAEEVSLHLWRMDVELEAVNDQVVQQYPDFATKLMNQRMKYLGHLLETVHKAAAMGLYTPTPAERAKLDAAAERLADTILEIDKLGYLADLPSMKTADTQTYLDYVGDSAHAKRGLDLHIGAGEVRF